MNELLVDVNVDLGRWPTRRLAEDETAHLVAKLKSRGVTEAWVGSYDGLLHKDIAAVNARLANECKSQKDVRLIPFGSINPVLPDWEEDLRRCADEFQMPGIRLHPAYHGYKVDHPPLARLLKLAADRGLIVQLAVTMEDERMMHPLLRVPVVDLKPLPAVVKTCPDLKLVLLNALGKVTGDALTPLRSGQIYVELSTLEGVGGLINLLRAFPIERVLFGSHAPLFYFEAAQLKLKESALSPPELKAIQSDNARRLLPA